MKCLPGGVLLCVFCASLEFADMLLWNAFQVVSCCVPSRLQLNLLTCYYEIPSRGWVAVCLLGSTWSADMLLWNLFQRVSCSVPLGLHLKCWHAAMKSLSESELLCASQAPVEVLTCCYETPSRWWVAVSLWGSSGTGWHAAMKYLPGGELLSAFQSPHKFTDMLPWNSFQWVSCCMPPRLHLKCWHGAIKCPPVSELMCASQASTWSANMLL